MKWFSSLRFWILFLVFMIAVPVFTGNIMLLGLNAVLSFTAALIISRLARQSEEKLLKSEERFRAIVSNTPDHILIQDRQLRHTFVANPLLGLAEQDMLGKTDHDFLSEEEAEKLTRIKTSVLKSGQPAHFETSLISREGKEEYFDGAFVPKFDIQGKVDGLIGYFRNITEHKRVTETLHAREEQLRLVTDHVPVFIAQCDHKQRYKFVNKPYAEMFGLQPADIVGKHTQDILGEEAYGNARPHMEAVLAGQCTEYDIVMPLTPGGRKMLRVSYSPEFDASGRVIGFIAAIIDITARKQAEDALRQSQERLRNLIDGLGPSIFVGLMTPDGTMIEANQPALAAAGLKPEDVLGKRFEETYWWAYSPEVQQQLRAAIARAARGEPSRYDVEVRGAENRFISLDFSLEPLRDETGRVVFIVPSASVVTERKQVEDELRKYRDRLKALVQEKTQDLEKTQGALVNIVDDLNERSVQLVQAMEAAQAADRIKSAFLATMSHELRTPMNSIIGFTGILLQSVVGPLNEEQHKQLSMVQDSARHLLALINDVLDISKIEAGQVEIVAQRFDMPALIQKITEKLTPSVEKKGLGLSVRIAPDVGAVVSDRRRVEQILINLLGNAVKFTERGEVRLECAIEGGEEDGRVVTRVADTGIGMKPEDMDMIFKPFQQIDSGLTRQYEGTGLGLSICKRLVELLGGTMWVESEWGRGSAFAFTLPLRKE